jgi:undecaprenyl-diphosphatase
MVKYIALGLIQGFTEFLPVSSSGHLAVAQKLWGLTEQSVAIAVIMHLGTLLAVIAYFFKDILKAARDIKMLGMILLVTFITGIIGFTGKDFFEQIFSSVKAIAIGWLISGIILLLTKSFMSSNRAKPNIKDCLILGVTQGIAIIPGVSRSGITLSTLLFRKIEKISSFNFSFLVSIPAVAGAAILEAKKIGFALNGEPKGLIAGFLCSFVSGLFALWLLKKVLDKAKFYYFGYYCIAIAVFTFIFIK